MTTLPRELKCINCGCILYNDINTYGDVGQEMCYDCYTVATAWEQDDSNEWYGMAPHHHDMSITGGWLFSTVFDPLPPMNANGEYEIEPGLFFRPDMEVDGAQGIWRDERREVDGDE